jgi:hypothetical protein
MIFIKKIYIRLYRWWYDIEDDPLPCDMCGGDGKYETLDGRIKRCSDCSYNE